MKKRIFVGGAIMAGLITGAATLALADGVGKTPSEQATEEMLINEMTQHRNWRAADIQAEADKRALQSQFNDMQKQIADMTAKLAVYQGKVDAAATEKAIPAPSPKAE